MSRSGCSDDQPSCSTGPPPSSAVSDPPNVDQKLMIDSTVYGLTLSDLARVGDALGLDMDGKTSTEIREAIFYEILDQQNAEMENQQTAAKTAVRQSPPSPKSDAKVANEHAQVPDIDPADIERARCGVRDSLAEIKVLRQLGANADPGDLEAQRLQIQSCVESLDQNLQILSEFMALLP